MFTDSSLISDYSNCRHCFSDCFIPEGINGDVAITIGTRNRARNILYNEFCHPVASGITCFGTFRHMQVGPLCSESPNL